MKLLLVEAMLLPIMHASDEHKERSCSIHVVGR